MKELKRRFVYHMWVPDVINEDQRNIIKVHISCIKRFIKQFNDIIIILAYDNNINAVNKLKHIFIDLIEIDEQSITIKICKNTAFREATTAKEYIYSLDKNPYDELIFFGHSKDLNNLNSDEITNKNSLDSNFENISLWVVSMYYYNLFFEAEVDRVMTQSCYYGFLLLIDNFKMWMYAGSFYWINRNALITYSKQVFHTYNNLFNAIDKTYAETTPNNLISLADFYFISSHNNYYFPAGSNISNVNMYTNSKYYIRECSGSQEDYKNFIDFYNSILDEIKIYDIDI